MRSTTLVTQLAVLAAFAAPALGATIRVPRDEPTIQDAVDAASDGDTILVTRGVYIENVVAALDNLTFKGRGRPVWDGNVANSQGNQLELTGDNARVQGFRFRGGFNQVRIAGDDATVRGCIFDNAGDHAISIGGDFADQSRNQSVATNAVVEGCRVTSAAGAAIRVVAGNAIVRRNRVTRSLSNAIIVAGNASTVTQNTVDGAWVHGLMVNGDDCDVTRNRVVGARIKGIVLQGGDSTVSRNRVSGSQNDGIFLSFYDESGDDEPLPGTSEVGHVADRNIVRDVHHFGIRSWDFVSSNTGSYPPQASGGAVTNNKVSRIARDAIQVRTRDMDVTGNRLTAVAGLGFVILADDCTLSRNLVTNSGAPGSPAYLIYGNDISLTRDTAKRVGGDGFFVIGNDASLTDCVALACDEDGFDVDDFILNRSGSSRHGIPGLSRPADGTTLTRCRAQRCEGEGLDHSGVNTTVSSSTFLKNRLDVGDDGSFTDFATSNRFNSGGVGTAPEVDVDVELQDTD